MQLFNEAGFTVVAISDSSGGVYNRTGLSASRVYQHVSDGGWLADYCEAEHISNAELLALDVDVLAPAAIEGQIHAGNAATVRAEMIVEGANGPVTPEADALLNDRGVVVVPRHPRQRRWRYGVLLRVGAGHTALLLEPRGDQQAASRPHAAGPRKRSGIWPRIVASTCARRPTRSPWGRVAEATQLRGIYP